MGWAMTRQGDIGEVSPLVEFVVKNPGLSASLLTQHVMTDMDTAAHALSERSAVITASPATYG
jgi:hypothetical protein